MRMGEENWARLKVEDLSIVLPPKIADMLHHTLTTVKIQAEYEPLIVKTDIRRTVNRNNTIYISIPRRWFKDRKVPAAYKLIQLPDGDILLKEL